MRWGSALCAVAVLGSAMPAFADEVVPGRIVVRYRDGVDACTQCVLAQGAATGRNSLDELQAKLGVRAARPLFQHDTRGRRAAPPASRVESARQRFPRRAARAPRDAIIPDLSRVYVLEVPEGTDLVAASRRLAADPDVAYAHPDYIRRVDFVPDDPYFASSGSWGQGYDDLWGLHITDADLAWDVSTGAGVTVGVVDTGVDANHAEIAGNLWTNPGEIAGNGIDDDGNGFVDDVGGWDFANDDAVPEDQNGHGTHVSGTIAATGDNGVGVIGMAFQSRIMPVKAFGPGGSAPSSLLAEAVVYAAENGADVISASWGGYETTQVLRDAVATARGLGVVFVAAAGNDGTTVNGFEPASLPGVIAVSATDHLDQPATFTNHGDAISVAAPGVDILSLAAAGSTIGPIVGGQYMHISGTSMATPHVSGLAALLLSAQPSLDADEVRWHLEMNADQPGYIDYEGEPWNPYFGYGRINAGRAFAPVPATSRVHPRRVERHAYVDTAGDLGTLDVTLTTRDPLPWTLNLPPWLVAGASSGSGPGETSLSFDLTGSPPGQSLVHAVAAEGPDLSGTEPLKATIHTHFDHRLGTELPLKPSTASMLNIDSEFTVRAATAGSKAFAAWNTNEDGVRIMLIDADGTFSYAPILAPDTTRQHFDVGSDGTSFILVWIDPPDSGYHARKMRRVLAMRYDASGAPLDQSPIVVDERSYGAFHIAYFPQVAFDGTTYWVVWQVRYIRLIGNQPYKTKMFLAPVGRNGSVGRRRRIATRRSQHVYPVFGGEWGCAPTGTCLFAWYQGGTQYALPIVNGRRDYSREQTLVSGAADAFEVDDVIGSPTGFLLTGRDSTVCNTNKPIVIGALLECQWEAKAQRVGLDGAPLDALPVRLDAGVDSFSLRTGHVQGAFDGTNYVVAFHRPVSAYDGGRGGGPVFMTRESPGGTIIDTEPAGLLVAPIFTGGPTAVALPGGKPLVLWRDSRDADISYSGSPAYTALYGQRMNLP